jgi:hypothetical protein
MLEHAIQTGRGGCYPRLTPGQYAKLRRHQWVNLSHGSLSTDPHRAPGATLQAPGEEGHASERDGK